MMKMKIAGSLFHWFYAIFNCFQIWLIESAGAINCYSCMSYIYGANWEYLEYKDLYFRPAAFTDRCTNISEHGGHIGRIPCLHNCILIVEKMRVGARGHNGYIRGCYDHIFRHGFNDSSVLTTKLKYREFCTRTMMSSLIARKDKPPDTELFICSCRDSLCNSSICTAQLVCIYEENLFKKNFFGSFFLPINLKAKEDFKDECKFVFLDL
ncbi:V-set and immunoglobulin domain-containing protein 10-like [Trichinella spiralis]|uniref:V-set and immunoglobulin domain-containing protein 10-like n=1 Tax=Trichinella spiralis TaxID=6334 RepID=A0ABR3KJZ2_TRISP